MAYYPSKELSLNGYKMKHWSKMKVGDNYEFDMLIKRKRTMRGKTRIARETYYLVKTN